MRTKYIVSAIRFALVSREFHRECMSRRKRISEAWATLRLQDKEIQQHHGRFA